MDLTEVLSNVKIEFCRSGEHHHVRDGWLGVDCPWCPPPIGNKGRYRLGVEISTGRCSCWVCGRHSLASVLVEAGKVNYRTAKQLLSNVKLVKFIPTVERGSGRLLRPKGVGPLQPAHVDYLKRRGFQPDSIQKLWNVQGIGISSELQWRLFIPVTLDGVEVSWTTRSISETNPRRYISAQPRQERIHLKRSLYGVDLARTTVVVVEGPTDVWSIGPGAVATFGLIYTPTQIDMIRRFPWRIVCFDNSPDAQRRADHLCETLSMFPGQTSRVCLDAADPGSASRDEIRRLRRMAFGE